MADKLGLKRFLMLCVFVLFYAGLEFVTYNLPSAVIVSLCLAVVLLFLIYPKLGVVAFVSCMFLSDFASRYDIRSTGGMSSMHTVYLGPFNLFTYMLLAFSAVAIATAQIKRIDLVPGILKRPLSLVVLMYFMMAVVGSGNAIYFPRQYVSDLATLVNLAGGYLIVRVFWRDERSLNGLVWCLLYIFGARTMVGLFRFFMDIGYKKGIALLPFYDPVAEFSIFTVLVCMSMLIYAKRFDGERTFLFFLIVVALSFLIFWPSRGGWIFMMAGMIYVSSLMKVSDKVRLRIVFLVGIFFLGAILFYFKRDIVEYALWKLSTLRLLPQMTGAETTISQRFVEMTNIFCRLRDDSALLWGQGAGAWFDDRYIPFSLGEINSMSAQSAFTDTQLQEWKFFSPHGMHTKIFLKSGVIGLGLFFTAIFMIMRRIWGVSRDNASGLNKAMLMGLCFPCIYQMLGFSSKNYVTAGILLGAVAGYLMLQEAEWKKSVQKD